jgi:ATP-dependent DNA helicase DinG
MIKPNLSFEIEQLFADGGPLGNNLPKFESRSEQVQMACGVYEALLNSRRFVVEAGTGVGKSFAYLIPAIHNLGKINNCKTLVSTFTITLQEQLINKDIPALDKALAQNFSAQLAKGRTNYLCLRRLQYALRQGRGTFTQIADELEQIKIWSENNIDGSRSDLDFVPSVEAWDAVRSEHGNCPARRCSFFKDCFWRKARRKLENADIIVANHALMFSDMVLKEQGHSLLPDYDFVIIDEAHNMETVAQDHFGIDISNRRVSYLLDKLFNNRTKRGLLAFNKQAEKLIDAVESSRTASRKFFKTVRNWYEQNARETGGRCYSNFVDDILSGHLKVLRTQLSSLANKTEDIDDKYEIIRYANLAAELVLDIENFLGQKQEDHVYWIELNLKRQAIVRLKSAPLNVGLDVRKVLLDAYDSVIMTSATLSCDGGSDSAFDFFASRVGLDNFDSLKLGSPFDFDKNVTVYIEKYLPEPNNSDFIEAASEKIEKYVSMTDGRAFVLFTSYDMLNKVAQKCTAWFAENDYNFLCQGNRFDRSTLLKKFTAHDSSVLFGTDSFWQGVDVPGEALSNVIIVKLPFAVPNHPLVAGRMEQIRQQGGNPFFDYQLPSAIIKFKQGFGRLIRSKTDTGIIAVLDSRIANKKYGRRFLASIPRCKVKVVGSTS